MNDGTENANLHLPEDSNGLGYQNLISMVFRLMSYRDAWMLVGKAEARSVSAKTFRPPLHLVLIEEPEAHLHTQVQQVFIRQAYKILRNHGDLGAKADFATQLIVSTLLATSRMNANSRHCGISGVSPQVRRKFQAPASSTSRMHSVLTTRREGSLPVISRSHTAICSSRMQRC
jgi:AAA ATPase domain